MKLFQIITTDSLVLNIQASSMRSLREYLNKEGIKPIIITVIG